MAEISPQNRKATAMRELGKIVNGIRNRGCLAIASVVILLINTATYSSSAQTFSLHIEKQGTGDGSVGGNVMNCPPGCRSLDVEIAAGQTVILAGQANESSEFLGFMGDTCYSDASCSFEMSEDLRIVAGFASPPPFSATHSRPASGDTTTSTREGIRVCFNRDIIEGPGIGAIQLRKEGELVPIQPYTYFEKCLRLNPTNYLTEGSSYEVDIPSDAVLDGAGSPLSSPHHFSFTAVDPTSSYPHLAAYPTNAVEGGEVRLSIWFHQPTPYDRFLRVTAAPDGIVNPTGLGEHVLSAGENLLNLDLSLLTDHGDVRQKFVTIQVEEDELGINSSSIEISNITSRFGSSLRLQSAVLSGDDDNDGSLEAGENGDIDFTVENIGPQIANALHLDFAVLNSHELRILGGEPFTCALGSLTEGQSRSCDRTLQADEELPTGSYILQVSGRSDAGTFLIPVPLDIASNYLPDYRLNDQWLSASPRVPGSQIVLEYVALNRGDGFNIELPEIEVTMEGGSEPETLFRTYANVRGDLWVEELVVLSFPAPEEPGEYLVRATINPPSELQIPEEDYSNNEAEELLVVVGGAPVLDEIDPQTATIGELLTFTATATDFDGDPITFDLDDRAPAGAQIDPNSGEFSWIPRCGQHHHTEFDVTATDNNLKPDSEPVMIKVDVEADLQVQISTNDSQSTPGSRVAYTVEVSNTGPSCAQGALVTSENSSGLIRMSWRCRATPGSHCRRHQSGPISFESIDLLPGGMATFQVYASIAHQASEEASSHIWVGLQGIGEDPDQSNNVGSVVLYAPEL